MPDFEILKLNESDKWNHYIQYIQTENKDIYFTPSYYQLYENLGDGIVQCFVFKKDKFIALYPFLLNCINDFNYNLDNTYYDIQGSYGYNGVISNSFDSSFIDEFYNQLNQYCIQKNIIAEFTRFHPLLNNYKFSQNHLSIILDRETVALDLAQHYETIWSNEYSSVNRNMIRKAQNLGYTIDIIKTPSVKQIDKFISIYHYSMQKAGAENYYFFNKDYFLNTFKFLSKQAYLFNICDINKQVVCSSIFFHYYDSFHYHLSGRTEKADNSVNNFLLDEAIKYAQNEGAIFFHFGGGRSSAVDDSLLKFKSNFSKTRLPFYIGKKVHNKEIYNEVVKQWEENNPEKKGKFNNHILKYKF